MAVRAGMFKYDFYVIILVVDHGIPLHILNMTLENRHFMP